MSETQEAWRAMEIHHPHQTRTLGISNIYHPETLKALYDFATVKPSVVQNRFYPATGYDTAIRAFCKARGIRYQSFWTLTANPGLLKSRVVGKVGERVGVGRAVALYGLVVGLGDVSVLCGTTNGERMREDLEGVGRIEEWSNAEPEAWKEQMDAFRAMVDI